MAVALVRGHSINEAAEEFGIAENTARTQVKSVLSKTQTHRQSDLVRLLLTSLARLKLPGT
jgi:DNA-binding CsgD family transcriptional regulator